MTTPLPTSFVSKKARILEQLSIPISEYGDLSPKGSIDVGIRELIDEINAIEGCVTTSSCAGRISVFLEGRKNPGEDVKEEDGEAERVETTVAGVGGKGGGGRWLFVSHDPVEVAGCGGKGSWAEKMGMQRLDDSQDLAVLLRDGERRLVHFKFEPMILHILTSSLQQAQFILSAALQAGFRESGALNLTTSSTEPATPMVGIRSMGLALESAVGFGSEGRELCMVPEWQLRNLIEVSNERFRENGKRIERFRGLLGEMGEQGKGRKGENGAWEDKEVRRERMRAEGLERAKEKREANGGEAKIEKRVVYLGIIEHDM